MLKSGCFDPLHEVAPRLTSTEIRALTNQLPKPLSVWSIGQALFEVYRVKELFNPSWPNEVLRELLVHARGSYYIYGERPPLDEYDAKSAPYLVRVEYPISDPPSGRRWVVEEWLSDRLVPCTEAPVGGGELEYFLYQSKSMDYWLQRMCFQFKENYQDYTFASNRMCSISPYLQDEEIEKSGISFPARQFYTAFCYTLMRHHFLEDYLEKLGARYKTSILMSRVIEKSMSVKIEERAVQVEFTPAYQFFGLSNPKLIQLDRQAHGGASYQFPGYFLDTGRLVGLLRGLLKEGKLSVQTILHYLGEESVARELLGTEEIHFEKLKNIGKLLSEAEQVFDSSLTGEELRRMIDEEVPDGPELKISKIETLRQNRYEILAAAGAVRRN